MKGKKNSNSKKKTVITKNKNYNSKVLYLAVILLVFLLIIVSITFSYAFWTTSVIQSKDNTVEAGCLSFTLNDKDLNGNSTNISLINTYPMSDEKGLTLNPYKITIKNTCNLKANFGLYFHNLASSTIASDYMKIALKNESNTLTNYPQYISSLEVANLENGFLNAIGDSIGNTKEDYLLNSFTLSPEQSITFELNLWLSIEAPNSTMGQTYESGVSVYAVPIK